VFDKQYADRWRTLLSVDDLVEAVVNTLTKLDILDKTFIFYTSDHGFHLGHLKLGFGKGHFYEFDARVMMLIRGPGVASNSTPAFIAGNTDLAPTFLDLAGVAKPSQMDGRSILPVLLPNVTASTRMQPSAAAPLPPVPVQPSSSQEASSSKQLKQWPCNVSAAGSDAVPAPVWRTSYPIEFSGLSAWPGPGKRLNDCPNNTYRSIRTVDPAARVNRMVAELTAVSDYDYDLPNW